MKTVELIYEPGCPKVTEVRTELMRAFSMAGVPARWVEWDRSDPTSPAYVRNYDSPTVLVDRRDVTEKRTKILRPCLVRNSEDGHRRIPTAAVIAGALGSSVTTRVGNTFLRSFAILPGVGVSLLPAGVCPACWPLYAGILSSVGVGFLLKERYLLFLIVILLLFAVISLAYGGWKRGRYAPFLLGLTAAVMVVAGKFVYEFSALVYGGAALLLTASVWNGWPRKTTAFGKGACSACASGEQASRVDQPEANPGEGGSS